MADLTFRLFGQDVSASAALRRVGDEAERAGNRVSGAFDSIRNVAGGYLIGQAAYQVAQWGEQLVQFGLTTTATMEQAQIGFATLLGSETAAGDYLKQLNAFAAATPFTFPGVEHGAQQLLGVGVAAQQVIPILTDLGDAAGANAIDQAGFERVMVGVTQSISAGTIKLQDMNQIADSMPSIWKLLAEALGKPMPVIKDMISKGQLLSADVLPKLFAQMHKDYGGAMAKQSQTLAGLWSTLTDTIGQGMAKVLTPLEPLMKQGITGAINAVGGAVTWVSGAFAEFGPAVGRVHAYFQPLIDVVESLWQWIAGSLWPALQAVAAQVLPALQGAIADVTSVIHDHAGAFQTIGQIITTIVLPAIGTLVSWLTQLVGPAFRLVMVIVEDGVIPVFLDIASVMAVVYDKVSGAFAWMLKAAATAADALGQGGVAGSLRNAASQIDSYAAQMNAAIQGIKDRTVTVNVVTRSWAADAQSDYVSGLEAKAAGNQQGYTPPTGAQLTGIKLPGTGTGVAKLAGGASSAKAALAAVSTDLKSLVADLESSRQKAGAAFASLAGDVTKEGSKAGRAIVDAAAQTLLPLAQTYENVVARLKTAQDQLKALRDQAAQYAAQVQQQVIESAGVASAKSVGAILTGLTDAIGFARQFATALAKLRADGLNSTTLGQIVSAGPEQGLKLAEQVLAGGKGTVNQINSLQGQLATAAGQIGSTAEHGMYDAGIQAAAGLVKGLAAQEKSLEAQMVRLATVMANALKKALKIKSPSQVFAEIGVFTGQGLIAGMDSQHAAIAASASRMLGAVKPAAAAGRGGGDVHVHVHNAVVGSNDQLARHIQTVLRSGVRSGVLAVAR